jgi:hypothetical protein
VRPGFETLPLDRVQGEPPAINGEPEAAALAGDGRAHLPGFETLPDGGPEADHLVNLPGFEALPAAPVQDGRKPRRWPGMDGHTSQASRP